LLAALKGAPAGGTRIASGTQSQLSVVFSSGGSMDESLRTTNLGYALPSVEERNRVLRNTYWLLALSMVPTVLGAWLGVATGIMATMGVGMSFIVFMVGAFGFIYAIEKTKNSATGVPVLLGFTFFMGLMLSRLIGFVLGMQNGPWLIGTAFAGTGLTFFGMAALSTLIKRDLTTMGKFLYVGAVMLLIAIVLNIFVQSSALFVTIAVVMVGIFSAFIIYDLRRVRDGLETNYISATLSIYLDLYNIFQALLSLLGFASRE
jgi:modulator of FtsH protease